MGSLKLTTASSGSVILSPANTASDVTITVPAVTGTMATIGPAFSAYISSTQTISAGTFTKAQFNTEEFDTNSNYDATTNYRFTPTVAGYYQITVCVQKTSSATDIQTLIYKNGSAFKNGVTPTSTSSAIVTALVYMNGSTDYVEGYVYMGSGGATTTTASSSYFQASMVRAA